MVNIFTRSSALISLRKMALKTVWRFWWQCIMMSGCLNLRAFSKFFSSCNCINCSERGPRPWSMTLQISLHSLIRIWYRHISHSACSATPTHHQITKTNWASIETWYLGRSRSKSLLWHITMPESHRISTLKICSRTICSITSLLLLDKNALRIKKKKLA